MSRTCVSVLVCLFRDRGSTLQHLDASWKALNPPWLKMKEITLMEEESISSLSDEGSGNSKRYERVRLVQEAVVGCPRARG